LRDFSNFRPEADNYRRVRQHFMEIGWEGSAAQLPENLKGLPGKI
jgi:hypothetical protein